MCKPLSAKHLPRGQEAGASGAEGRSPTGEGSPRVLTSGIGWEFSVQGGGKGKKISKAQTRERAWSVRVIIPVPLRTSRRQLGAVEVSVVGDGGLTCIFSKIVILS